MTTALRQRSPAFKSTMLRQSARGRECTVCLPNCNQDPETTVLAHLNFDGGTMAGKSDDFSACFACSSCHEAIDRHEIDPLYRSDILARALVRTQKIWFNTGLLVVSGKGRRK